jgi:hypothetical protein
MLRTDRHKAGKLSNSLEVAISNAALRVLKLGMLKEMRTDKERRRTT